MFGHLEFYFGKYVPLECSPIPALILGMFQFHHGDAYYFHHHVLLTLKPNKSNVYEQLENGKRLDRPDNCSRDCYAVMRSCWEWNEKERKTFYELYDLLQRLLDRYLRENHDFMRAYQPQG